MIINGKLFTEVFHKPSNEPYFLPFTRIHPLHMKKNIPFTMILRPIRYYSTFDSFIAEGERIKMASLFNKYPNKLIDKQLQLLLDKYEKTPVLTASGYPIIRKTILKLLEPEKTSN